MADWHGAEDGDGNKYFYNDAGETRWDRPEGYVTSEEEDEDDDEDEALAEAVVEATTQNSVDAGDGSSAAPAEGTAETAAAADAVVATTEVSAEDNEEADAGSTAAVAAPETKEEEAATEAESPAEGDTSSVAAEPVAEEAAAEEAAVAEAAVAEAEVAEAAVSEAAVAEAAVAEAAAAEALTAEAAATEAAASEAAATEEVAEVKERDGDTPADEVAADPASGAGLNTGAAADTSASSNGDLERQMHSLKAENEQLQQDKSQLQSELAKERVKAMGSGGGSGGGGGGGSSGSSDKMIEQAEKLMKMQQNYAKEKEKASNLEFEVGAVRETMVRHIAGSSADGASYQNVPLGKLLDLYKKSFVDRANSSSRPGSRPTTATGSRPASNAGHADAKKLQNRVRELEKELEELQIANKRLRRSGHGAPASDGIVDYASYPAKLQNQKRMYVNSQAKLKDANEKIVKLSQHIEKLMLHLKHESAAKVKAAKTVRRLEQTTSAQKEYIRSLESKLGNRDKTIKQLRAGAKILEDQLQLMDEKYIEIRGKLDWTRLQSKREVAKIQKEANGLRAKWALAGGLDLEHLVGKSKSSKMSKLKTEKPHGPSASKRNPFTLPSTTQKKRSSAPPGGAGNPEVASHLPWSDQKTASLASESR